MTLFFHVSQHFPSRPFLLYHRCGFLGLMCTSIAYLLAFAHSSLFYSECLSFISILILLELFCHILLPVLFLLRDSSFCTPLGSNSSISNLLLQHFGALYYLPGPCHICMILQKPEHLGPNSSFILYKWKWLTHLWNGSGDRYLLIFC